MNRKVVFIVVLTIFMLLFSGCAPHFHLDFLGKERIQEVVLIESKAREKILVLDLCGTITTQKRQGILDRDGDLVSSIYYRLKKADEDPLVKGVILRLDTPGGEGTASDIIYNEILRFKKSSGMPVVALMMGMAASGGYYAACACDAIIAHPTTVTGSIGVIAVLPGLKGVLNKIGVDVNIIKAGKMKDAASPFKDLSQEERDYIQGMVDQLYERFLQVVHRCRKRFLSMEEIKEIADGRVYTAEKALELKLIDKVGYFDTALQEVLSMAEIKDARVIAYTYHPARKTNIYANTKVEGSPLSFEITVIENFMPNLNPGFYYIWLPMLKP